MQSKGVGFDSKVCSRFIIPFPVGLNGMWRDWPRYGSIDAREIVVVERWNGIHDMIVVDAFVSKVYLCFQGCLTSMIVSLVGLISNVLLPLTRMQYLPEVVFTAGSYQGILPVSILYRGLEVDTAKPESRLAWLGLVQIIGMQGIRSYQL